MDTGIAVVCRPLFVCVSAQSVRRQGWGALCCDEGPVGRRSKQEPAGGKRRDRATAAEPSAACLPLYLIMTMLVHVVIRSACLLGQWSHTAKRSGLLFLLCLLACFMLLSSSCSSPPSFTLQIHRTQAVNRCHAILRCRPRVRGCDQISSPLPSTPTTHRQERYASLLLV